MGNIRARYLSGHQALKLLFPFIFLLGYFPALAQQNLDEIQVSIEVRNRPLTQVLEQITLQTSYHFTYDSDLVDSRKRVSISMAGMPLTRVLDSLLDDPSLDYRKIRNNVVIFQKNLEAPIPISAEIRRSLIEGIVVDGRTGKALPYATVALLETKLGTISNADGYFSIKAPLDISDPVLNVSYMGYRNLLVPIVYPLEEELHITLDKEFISLQEVIIRYADPYLLLKEAIGRIGDNYLTEASSMKAFYRESVRNNEHCMIYSEAVLDIAKSSYTSDIQADKISIRKKRTYFNVNASDSLLVKLRSGITSSISLDIIKNRPEFLREGFRDYYVFEYRNMTNYNGHLVYVIAFKQREEINELGYVGQIYLDHKNLAILAIDFEFDPKNIHKEPGLFMVSRSSGIKIRPLLARYHVSYRYDEAGFFINQVRAEVEMKVRKRRRWIGNRYQISIELAVTDIQPGTKLKIDPARRVRNNQILSDEPARFDPEFWGIYNTIKPEATLVESLKQLEKHRLEISE